MSKNKKHRTQKKKAITKNVSSQSSQILKILQQAQQYQKAGDWQKAEALCHQVLQRQPKNDSALDFYKQLSAALNSKGRTTEALAYLQRALSFNPNHAEMQNNLGIIFGQQGKLDQAKTCFENAIAGKKDFAQAYYNLGIILNGEEQFAQAITCYQKALSITPNYADAYNNLGNALSGQNKFSEAIINYQKAITFNPNYAEAHNNLGVAFKKQGQITEAIASFRQAIDLKGNYTSAKNNLAVTLNEQRQFEPDNANSYGALAGASKEPVVPDTNNTPWKVVNGLVIEGVPPDFELPLIVGENNNYSFIEEKRKAFVASEQSYTLPVSIIIPVYNRKEKLAKTLAAITHQTYPANLIEVIVADDGSSDGVAEVIEKYQKYLSLKYVRQDDQGYRLSAVRNLGLNLAQYDHISILDCDILPTPKYIELLMQYFHVTDKAALMGHRRFVCTDNIADDQILADVNIALNLPDVMPSDKNDRPKKEGEPIIDHRFRLYEKNDYLKQSLFPFSAFYGCSMTFPKKVIGEVGPFDEDFQAWGHEDVEMGYRIYNAGYYFIPVLEAMGLHQEPPGGENESNRSEGLQITNHLLAQKCPIARQYQANVVYEIPKVSIYMAAYNAEKYIKRAVDSALAQTYTDLEVCIVNDGSTDNTLKVLEQNYQNNPRVRWISQKNSGVANTFNAAVGLCRGMYLAHLDADDILLRLDAVEIMVKYLYTYNVGCVYSYCRKIDENNMTVGEVGSLPFFCREKFMNSMIVSHFRLFRKCDWARLDGGFDETLENAEDYDLFLRLSEICSFHHLHTAFYGYRWHGENVSIIHQERQIKHHGLVIQRALKRNGMDKEWEAYVPDPKKPRTTLFRKKVLDAQAESSVVDKLYEYALAYPNSRHNIQEIHDAFSLIEGVQPRGKYQYAGEQTLIPLFKAKILYTPIPKCACSSVKHLIFECERGMSYNDKMTGNGKHIHQFYNTWNGITNKYLFADNWLKVLIVREPLQRLVSCYKNRVLFSKDLFKSADRLSKVGLPVNPSWEVFIDNFERYRSLSQSINHHSAPIVNFAGYNPDFYDLILNISELDKLLSVVSDRSHCHIEMPRKQTGGSEIDIGEISETAKEKIHRLYANDYEIYGKYFGSASSQDLMKVKNKAFKQPDQGQPQNSEKNDTLEDVTIIIKTFLRPHALERLLQDIKKYYPEIKVYVADDGDKPQVRNDVDEYFVLPFDTGLSYGRNYLIDRVKTKYVMLLDDDTIFTENTKIEWALEVFNRSHKIDLVSGRYLPFIFYGSLTIENNNLIRNMGLARTIVDGFPIFDFVPNFFVAKTEKLKKIRWNEKLKIQEHIDFFWRARKELNCTYLPYFVSINSHARESTDYSKYRTERAAYFQKMQAKEIGVSAIVSKENHSNYKESDVCSMAYNQPEQGHSQDYIFVLSHMRSYSSLLCHILGNHSEVSGYSEMHRSYSKLNDLLVLKQKVAVATDNQLFGSFILDKVLSPNLHISDSILNNDRVRLIFLLRNPEDTIKSILNMGINLGSKMEWHKDVDKVLAYYINRLKQIENYSLKMQKSALFIASEKILDDSEQTLKQLTGFLGLKTKLEKDYSIFKYTGLRGHGDPSAVIKEGKMIHQKSHYDIHIPSYILAQAQKSYDSCYRVLSKHLDSQTQESYHSYHDVLPKHLLFQSILIITYGRSGSTLLQGILNSIDGCLIRGENSNFCFHLFKSYNAIVTAKKHKNANSTTNAWYGASLLDEKKFIHQTKHLVKEFLLADKISDKNITCYGFKEIRYLEEMDSFFEYLEFLKNIFPNVAFIFNTRNLDDVVKSAFMKEEEPEELKKRILKLESLFAEYCKRYENGFHITYEDVVSKSRKLEEMFRFIGVKYEPEKIDNVLSLPHSYAPTQEHVKKIFKDNPRIT